MGGCMTLGRVTWAWHQPGSPVYYYVRTVVGEYIYANRWAGRLHPFGNQPVLPRRLPVILLGKSVTLRERRRLVSLWL